MDTIRFTAKRARVRLRRRHEVHEGRGKGRATSRRTRCSSPIRHRASFRGDSRFTTWLYRIAATTALMHLRKERRVPPSARSMPSPPTTTRRVAGRAARRGVVARGQVGLERGRAPGRRAARRDGRQVRRDLHHALPRGLLRVRDRAKLALNVATVKTRAYRARAAPAPRAGAGARRVVVSRLRRKCAAPSPPSFSFHLSRSRRRRRRPPRRARCSTSWSPSTPPIRPATKRRRRATSRPSSRPPASTRRVVPFGARRANVIARLKGDGSKRPLLLLAHLDVVGAAGQPWTMPPFQVTEKDGWMYGRGVTDDKVVGGHRDRAVHRAQARQDAAASRPHPGAHRRRGVVGRRRALRPRASQGAHRRRRIRAQRGRRHHARHQRQAAPGQPRHRREDLPGLRVDRPRRRRPLVGAQRRERHLPPGARARQAGGVQVSHAADADGARVAARGGDRPSRRRAPRRCARSPISKGDGSRPSCCSRSTRIRRCAR